MAGTRARTEEVLRHVIAPVVEALDADLDALDVRAVGRRELVRAVVDADGGLDLDRIADLSRAISAALDESAEVTAVLGDRSYVLEVSSPGVDRPLTLPRHWRRAAGRLVTAYLLDGTMVTDRLVSVDEASGTVTLGDRLVPMADLDRGVVQVEFTSAGGD